MVLGRGYGNHKEGPEVARPGIYLGREMLARHFFPGVEFGKIPLGSVVKHERAAVASIGVRCLPSQANFVVLDLGCDALIVLEPSALAPSYWIAWT